MTPQQWIDNCGIGTSFGSLYDTSFYKCYNKARYWVANGKWQKKINDGDWTDAVVYNETLKENPYDQLNTFGMTFTPTEDTVSITLKHPYLQSTNVQLPLSIVTVKLDNVVKEKLINTVYFPPFENKISTISLDLSEVIGESVANKSVYISFKLNMSEIPQFPTDNESTLSAIRTTLIDRTTHMRGFGSFEERYAKAIAARGFGAVRFLVCWSGHFDELDDNGNVHVDTEFLDRLGWVYTTCHNYGLQVMFSMCYDEGPTKYGSWINPDNIFTDPTAKTKYQSIYTQVATYFKDYGDWLAFGAFNEILNDAEWWDNATDNEIYGVMLIHQYFVEAVRAVPGNEERILICPTYAAKVSMLNHRYENPDDPSDNGYFHLPDDDHCICEVHPYSSTLETIQSLNKTCRQKHIPLIYGEFGEYSSQYNTNLTMCQLMAYTAAYAKYYGMGPFIWDDGGNMAVLKRGSTSMTNSNSLSIWNGAIFNFVPNLIKCGNLQEADVLLSNRRQDCYAGDTVAIYLDTKERTIISNEGNGQVTLNNNEFKAGTTDIPNLLAISYDGLYGVIDVTVDMPENWNEVVYDDASQWKNQGWSIYPAEGVKLVNTQDASEGWCCHLDLIEITSECTQLEWYNKYNYHMLTVVEYDKDKNMLTKYTTYGKVNWNHGTYTVGGKTKYVGVSFGSGTYGTYPTPTQGNVILKVKTRDMSATEDKDRTDDFVDNIMNYNNYNVAMYRTIDARGGIDYTIDFGDIDCDVYIREFNGEKLEAENWYHNGDTFTTSLFTNSMRIEIQVPSSKIRDVIRAFNNRALFPTLSYTDFYNRPSEYEEEYTHIPEDAQPGTKMVRVGNKLISYNGKTVKI